MRLSSLLYHIASLAANEDVWISGISQDSRRITSGTLFLAAPGLRVDGRDFIAKAIAEGASAIIYENADNRPLPFLKQLTSVPMIGIAHLNDQIGLIAARFYQQPTAKMTIIGVTGTNGKTSVSQFIAQALNTGRRRCAVVGTLGKGFLPNLQMTGYTTPDAIVLQKDLADCLDQGADTVAMEVSSHSLSQQRVAGVEFDIAVFTNLTQDHLDYHRTMSAYAAAKAQLFQFSSLKHAVYNYDDGFGRQLLNQHPPHAQAWVYSLNPKTQCNYPAIIAKKIEVTPQGFVIEVSTPWGDGILTSSLLGRFNASNLMAVLSVLGILEVPLAESLQALTQLQPVKGRMQTLGGTGNQPTVIVDFAHTPDALMQVLLCLREHHPRRLWCVFGCGGDRDPGKRPQMGAIAEKLSDQVVLTNDNPRSEKPEQIIAEIRAGMSQQRQTYVELDRAAAIAYAIQAAHADDIILIAGKGHETEQIVGNQVTHFSDVEAVQNVLTTTF